MIVIKNKTQKKIFIYACIGLFCSFVVGFVAKTIFVINPNELLTKYQREQNFKSKLALLNKAKASREKAFKSSCQGLSFAQTDLFLLRSNDFFNSIPSLKLQNYSCGKGRCSGSLSSLGNAESVAAFAILKEQILTLDDDITINISADKKNVSLGNVSYSILGFEQSHDVCMLAEDDKFESFNTLKMINSKLSLVDASLAFNIKSPKELNYEHKKELKVGDVDKDYSIIEVNFNKNSLPLTLTMLNTLTEFESFDQMVLKTLTVNNNANTSITFFLHVAEDTNGKK